MSARPRRAGLLALVALTAWLTQVGVAQPPTAAVGSLVSVALSPARALEQKPAWRASFTAFPDLLGMGLDFEKVIGPYPRPIPKDAPALTKVRIAQVNEGMTYIRKFKTQIDVGRFTSAEYNSFLKMTCEIFQVAALVDNDPAKKRAAYEAQVMLMWEMEKFTQARVDTGTDPAQQLNQARFYRLQAEAELLQFLDKK